MFILLFVLVYQCLSEVENITLRSVFKIYKERYHKRYSSPTEEEYRFKIFQKNFYEIESLNIKHSPNTEYGLNEFSDLSDEEFSSRYTMDAATLNRIQKLGKGRISGRINVDPPEDWDWKDKGAVTKVYFLGWAFSAVGNMEGVWFVQTGDLIDFSPQQLLDCDNVSSACKGGWPSQGIQSVIDVGGIERRQDYRYEGHKGDCRVNTSLYVANFSSYEQLKNEPDDIKAYMYKSGPLSACLNEKHMKHYSGGIIDSGCDNCPTGPNHCITLVGYGVDQDKGVKYWRGKNSWGAGWGSHGYFKIKRGTNCCGVEDSVVCAKV